MTLDDIKAKVAEIDRESRRRAGRNIHVMPNGTVHFHYDPIPKRMARRMLLRARKALSHPPR